MSGSGLRDLLSPAPTPAPAAHVPLALDDGRFVPLLPPPRVLGVGQSYAGHIAETAGRLTPGQPPPVFDKRFSPSGETVALPDEEALRAAMERAEPGLSDALAERGITPRALLDYEVELGLVLLEPLAPGDIDDPGRAPELGFFLANDLSERGLAILGTGQEDPYTYWGISKSHPGFCPAGARAWVPHTHVRDGLPRVTLRTEVDGELRQSASTCELVYTTTELLRVVLRACGGPLAAGTWLLTGTPAGVAVATPRWLVWAADAIGVNRFDRLRAKLRRPGRFLAPGDEVVVSGGGLGELRTKVVG